MNIIIKTALCLGVGLLMTIGQPDSNVKVANASPQQSAPPQNAAAQPNNGHVLHAAPPIVTGQANHGCDGNGGCDGHCASGNCSGSNGQCCGSCLGGIGQRGCSGGCASGNCGCGGGRLGCRLRNRRVCCPECQDTFLPQEYCELEVKEGETEKTCFEVDFKTICIPKIVPPWKDDCCTPKCAEARSVKVLKKKKYKCPTCKYSWKVVKPELPPAPEVHPTPAGQPVPANQGYYNQQPINPQHGVPATPAGTIIPVKPQAPPVGNYFGSNQSLPRPHQSAAHAQQIQIQQQAQLMQYQQMMQQQQMKRADLQLQRQAQLYRQQAAQQQAIPKTASSSNQPNAGGTLGDYYR